MTEKKKISLNFRRIDKAQVGAVAADTLGDVAATAPDTQPERDPAAAAPRGPIAFVKLDDQTLEVKEAGLTSTFNFKTRQVTYISDGAMVNVAVLSFEQVKSPTTIADAYANLKMLGGNPSPYVP